MRQLHPVFNVVKLSAALEDPILGRKLQAPPPPIVIDGEEEWEVVKDGILEKWKYGIIDRNYTLLRSNV